MGNVIPLHTIILVMQNNQRTALAEAQRFFPSHEIITPELILSDLVGQQTRIDLSSIALHELRHRATLKLSLGERVVVAGSTFFRQEQRMTLHRIAATQGASVIYWLGKNINDPNLLSGDNLAKVILDQDLYVIKPMQINPLPVIKQRFRGVTVFGDVHGNLKNLQDALAWAKSRRHYLWFLGDVIDYGSQSIPVMSMIYNLVMRGEASFMLGNHERKIARWINQQESRSAETGRAIRLSEGNKVTTEMLLKMAPDKRTHWYGQFRSLLNRAELISHLGKTTFTHAAIHPDFWSGNHDHQGIEDYALYGEADTSAGHFRLSYNWIDAVPSGTTVFVGHDVRSMQAPLVTTGAQGGRVIFLDTGSGKGGFLSTADLRFSETGDLNLENFNRY